MTEIIFEQGALKACNPYWFTFWPSGELRMFRDRAAAEAFASRQGLKPVFRDGAIYRWLDEEEVHDTL
jgi:hypothetical protein